MRKAAIVVAASILYALASRSASAELMYATTSTNLYMFDTAAPAVTWTNLGPLTGLQTGETILGIDVRPGSGVIYGLGSTSRLYTISTSAVVSQVGTSGQFTLSGTSFGVDFDPVAEPVGSLRVVSDTGQNLRIDPTLGSATIDTALTSNNIVAAAYNNNFVGATSSTLYSINSVTGFYEQISNPNNGGPFVPIGSLNLGTNLNPAIGHEISGLTGNHYASILVGNQYNLYFINAPTGATTLIGQLGSTGIFPRLGLAAAVPEPGAVAYGVIGCAIALRRRARVRFWRWAWADPAGCLRQTGCMRIVAVMVGFILCGAAAVPAQAQLWGTNGSNLVQINPANANVISTVSLTGLQTGETILALDMRAANNTLYGLGSTSRLYTISTGGATAGMTTLVGTPGLFTLSGNSFGIDFDPVAEPTGSLRVISDTGQNLRVDPTAGSAIVDGPVAGSVVAAAHFPSPTLSNLYTIDSVSGFLGVLGTPNAGGSPTVVGSLNLGTNLIPGIGFDISPLTGTPYATISVGSQYRLYTVNLPTGAATLVGIIGTGTYPLHGLAAAVPEPTAAMVALAGCATMLRRRARITSRTRCDDSGHSN